MNIYHKFGYGFFVSAIKSINIYNKFGYGFPYQPSFLPSRINLSEGLAIFLSLDNLCHHGKLSLLVICNSGVMQTIMMVDHMNRIVFSYTERPFLRMNLCLCLSMVFISSESPLCPLHWPNFFLCGRFLISIMVLSWFCHSLHSWLVIVGVLINSNFTTE